jgi:hypothetical protein
MDASRNSGRMSTNLISLDEASRRLEQGNVSARAFAELLVASPPLLLGLFPGKELHDPIDLSRVISLRLLPENVVVAGDVKWADVKLDWPKICTALAERGCKVSWSWVSDITPEALEKLRQFRPTRPLPYPQERLSAASAVARPVQRAGPEWFAKAVLTSLSGKAPPGKRGPGAGKRENTVAAIRKDLGDKTLTEAGLKTMREKELAARYVVSRDTARKARNDVLSLVEISASTNDK